MAPGFLNGEENQRMAVPGGGQLARSKRVFACLQESAQSCNTEKCYTFTTGCSARTQGTALRAPAHATSDGWCCGSEGPREHIRCWGPDHSVWWTLTMTQPQVGLGKAHFESTLEWGRPTAGQTGKMIAVWKLCVFKDSQALWFMLCMVPSQTGSGLDLLQLVECSRSCESFHFCIPGSPSTKLSCAIHTMLHMN